MNDLSDDVKRQAREAAEPMQGMVLGMKDVGSDHAERSNAYENRPEHVASYDTMLEKAVAQEKAMEHSQEHEHGHER